MSETTRGIRQGELHRARRDSGIGGTEGTGGAGLLLLCLLLLLLSCPARALAADGGALSPEEAQQFIQDHPDAVLVDIRTDREFSLSHLQGALNIPFKDLKSRSGEIPGGRPVVIYCGLGFRSASAWKMLRHIRPDIPSIHYIEGRAFFPE